ncbi:MAG: hypothetical protein EA402_04475 [Planctomycetota bacterium]|nr:MAG: hypothetical protein EA402_04475 [Planctomycetota bacterium]
MSPFGPASLQLMDQLAVVPVLIGPLQVLIAILPGLLASLAAALFALFKPRTFWLLLKTLWRVKLPLLAIVAVVGGGIWGLRAILPETQTAVGAAEGSDDTWPAFRGDLNRRGWQAGFPDPTMPSERWSFTQGHDTFYGSPAVVGNRLYIASSMVTLFNPTGQSELYCLDTETGGLVWRSGPPDYRATFSSVAVGEDVVAVGEGLHLTKDSRLSVLDRHTGELRWSYRSNSHMESSPAIGEGVVVVGAGQDGFYCFELEPDAQGNPVLRWHAPGPVDYADASGSPAIYNGRVYLPLGRWGGRALAALDLDSGEELWRTEAPYPVFSGPTVAHGQVFIGMGNGNFIQSAEQALPGELDRLRAQGASEADITAAKATLQPGGAVWSLDPETGAVNWQQDLPRAVLGQVAAGDSDIFAVSRDGHLYRFDLDGRPTGSFNAGAPILASPAVAQSHVYILNEQGRLVCLDQDSLRVIWEMSLGSGWPWIGSPTVARGTVFVGTIGGGVMAVGQSAEDAAAPLWRGLLGGAGGSGGIDDEDVGERGSLRWRHEPEGARFHMRAAAAHLDDLIILPIADEQSPGLLALRSERLDDGEPETAWSYTTSNPVYQSPALMQGLALVADGQPGDANRHLHAIDSTSGQDLWRLELASDAPGYLQVEDWGVLIADRAQGLSRLDIANGQAQWHSAIGSLSAAPAVADDLIAVSLAQPAGVAVIERHGGMRLWQIALDHAPRSSPVLRGRLLVIDDGEQLLGLRLNDGAVQWQTPLDGPINGPILRLRSRLAVSTENGSVYMLDAASGEIVRHYDDANPHLPPVFSRNQLLYHDQNGNWMATSLRSDVRVRWLAARWLGDITAPAIRSQGGILFPTAERGLIRAGRRE